MASEAKEYLEPSVDYDGYKLRLIYGNWYLLLFKGNANTGYSFGPFTHAQAVEYAKAESLVDVERELTAKGAG